jgi:hypothetical protein
MECSQALLLQQDGQLARRANSFAVAAETLRKKNRVRQGGAIAVAVCRFGAQVSQETGGLTDVAL